MKQLHYWVEDAWGRSNEKQDIKEGAWWSCANDKSKSKDEVKV